MLFIAFTFKKFVFSDFSLQVRIARVPFVRHSPYTDVGSYRAFCQSSGFVVG